MKFKDLLEGKTISPSPLEKNPTVSVPGYGTMSLDDLKKEVESRLKELVDRAKDGQYSNVLFNIDGGHGMLPGMLKAIIEVEERQQRGQDKLKKLAARRGMGETKLKKLAQPAIDKLKK